MVSISKPGAQRTIAPLAESRLPSAVPAAQEVYRLTPQAQTHAETRERALVALDAPRLRQTASRNRPSAPFLAQLIAVKEQLPQMAARRRIDPRAGTDAYAQVSRIVSRRDDDGIRAKAATAVDA